MKRNAREAIVMAILFAAAAGVGYWMTQAPSMQVASVNAERVVLEAGAPCGYTVWLNHAPWCDGCRYYDGVRVISGTSFSRLTVYWDAIDLDQPASGDCFCGHWHCRDGDDWYGGELWDVVAWKVWLPLVMSDG